MDPGASIQSAPGIRHPAPRSAPIQSGVTATALHDAGAFFHAPVSGPPSPVSHGPSSLSPDEEDEDDDEDDGVFPNPEP